MHFIRVVFFGTKQQDSKWVRKYDNDFKHTRSDKD